MSSDAGLLEDSATPAAGTQPRPAASVWIPEGTSDPALLEGPSSILLAGILAALGRLGLRKALHRRRPRGSCLGGSPDLLGVSVVGNPARLAMQACRM